MKPYLKKLYTMLFVPKGQQMNGKPTNAPQSKPMVREKSGGYFTLARHWADDFYSLTLASRNRWRSLALYVLLPLVFLLLVMMTFLVPAQHLSPLLINHYQNGLVTAQPMTQANAPMNQAQVESDLVRYIKNREAYSAVTYRSQYQLVELLSNANVFQQYLASQSSHNPNSPVNRLGRQGSRSVSVSNINFLDNVLDNKTDALHHDHHNLAQIDFTVTEFNPKTNETVKLPLSALVSWRYQGTPEDPNLAWENWDGFEVTYFKASERHTNHY